LARLLAFHDAAAVLRDYYLVGATSWSPTNFSVLAAFAGLSRDPIFVGISHADDVSRLGLMRPVLEPLPILASDWIHPDDYAPRPHRERSIDILMVAGFCRFKRHWLLFEALREMPRNLRVVLIGREALLDEARAFGVRQDLEVYTNLEHDELAARQCDARISLALSQREGSCVAAAESLFADSPVAMMEDAHIGARAYLNAETGLLLRRKGLARALMRFHEDSERFAPRRWAQEHIACTTTSARLNALLREWSLRNGRPWHKDIAPLCWRYVPRYVVPADRERLLPAVAELRDRHGVAIYEWPGEKASLLARTSRNRCRS